MGLPWAYLPALLILCGAIAVRSRGGPGGADEYRALFGCCRCFGHYATTEQLISYFKGELDEEIGLDRMVRNSIVFQTANLIIGLKDHMGHFILSDEDFERCYEISSKAQLVFMSHTQDPDHAERVVGLSKGRPIHLGHANAAGCGTHGDAKESMERIVALLKQPQVTGELVTAMLRPGRGSWEGLLMRKKCRKWPMKP
jgi:dihydroorotase